MSLNVSIALRLRMYGTTTKGKATFNYQSHTEEFELELTSNEDNFSFSLTYKDEPFVTFINPANNEAFLSLGPLKKAVAAPIIQALPMMLIKIGEVVINLETLTAINAFVTGDKFDTSNIEIELQTDFEYEYPDHMRESMEYMRSFLLGL